MVLGRVGVVHADRQRKEAKAQEMEDEAREAGGGHLLSESCLQLARIRLKEGGK